MAAASPPRPASIVRTSTTGRYRLAVSVTAALLLSGSIFWLLWVMQSGRAEQMVVSAIPRIDFSRLKQDTELQEVKRIKPVIDKPEPPPASPAVSVSKSAGVTVGVDVNALVPAGVDFGGFGGTGTGVGGSSGAQLAFGAGSDRGAVAMVRLDADYPEQARSRGIEGWVLLQYDVTASGSTENIIVLDSRPTATFDQMAIKAVKGWKYSPKVLNGKPVADKGLKHMMKFELE